MALFANPFYTDEDCQMVRKTAAGWSLRPFARDKLNRSSLLTNSKAFRTPFQRDLENLTFTGAFRRLQGKTQVRQVGPDCFSRTRLSHSIEIARIAQSIVSKAHILLDLPIGEFIDPDLVEFACFAHDIGNPPFGHAGERELNRQMQNGGFEGNAQSLRIVSETAWGQTGIEPTRAAVESILKYPFLRKTKKGLPEKRSQFLYDYQGELIQLLGIGTERSIECQIMDLADDIGNALIDFSDGARAQIITEDNVKDWLNSQPDQTSAAFVMEDVLEGFLNHTIMKNFSSVRVQNCIKHLQIYPLHGKAERASYKIALAPAYQAYICLLREMNKELLFTHPKIRASDGYGAFIVRTLFEIFRKHYIHLPSNTLCDNNIIPKDWHARLQKADEPMTSRIICDYISGMTDDYAKMTFDRAIAVAL
jgi:dGTPase